MVRYVVLRAPVSSLFSLLKQEKYRGNIIFWASNVCCRGSKVPEIRHLAGRIPYARNREFTLTEQRRMSSRTANTSDWNSDQWRLVFVFKQGTAEHTNSFGLATPGATAPTSGTMRA